MSESEATKDVLLGLRIDVVLAVSDLLREQKLTRAELARRIGKTRSWVDHLLESGEVDLTLEDIAKLFVALDEKVEITTTRAIDQARETAYLHGLADGEASLDGEATEATS
jgi:transcriptional regulator with XRE-family HTH domain